MRIIFIVLFSFVLMACQSTKGSDSKQFSSKRSATIYGVKSKKIDDCGPVSLDKLEQNGKLEAIPCVVHQPIYPRKLVLARVNGKVTFGFLLNEEGTVEKVRVIESTPEGKFDAAALQALAKWKFKVPHSNGDPVLDKELTYTLKFQIDS